MHTICPNCLRPVRAGAKYCGFCGTSLSSNGEGNARVTAALQSNVDTDLKSKGSKLPGPTYESASRSVAVTAIILLFLVIIVALIIRYWPDILVWIDQILPGLNIR